MKKILIIANSLYNVMLAVQVRRAMYPEEVFDIVVSDESRGLKEIYDNESLISIFSNVYYADNSVFAGAGFDARCTRLKGLVAPRAVITKILGTQVECDYTDIFFWNPDALFYYLYMEQYKKGIDFKLHLYCDAATGYYKAMPEDHASVIFKLYSSARIHKYLRDKYNVKYIREYKFDDYMFCPEYCAAEGNHETVRIPQIEVNKDTIDIYNKIFTSTLTGIDKYKYLVFAQPINDYFEDTSLYEKTLLSLVNIVGADNVVVKMHPRCNENDVAIYNKCGIKMVSDSSPWEMYCLNNDTTGKVYISIGSGAGVMPHLLYGQNNRTIMLYNMLKLDTVGNITPFYDKLGDYLDIPKSLEEFEKIIEDIEKGE